MKMCLEDEKHGNTPDMPALLLCRGSGPTWWVWGGRDHHREPALWQVEQHPALKRPVRAPCDVSGPAKEANCCWHRPLLGVTLVMEASAPARCVETPGLPVRSHSHVSSAPALPRAGTTAPAMTLGPLRLLCPRWRLCLLRGLGRVSPGSVSASCCFKPLGATCSAKPPASAAVSRVGTASLWEGQGTWGRKSGDWRNLCSCIWVTLPNEGRQCFQFWWEPRNTYRTALIKPRRAPAVWVLDI